MMRFGWNRIKNRTNRRDHGIDFDDAKAVFNGPTLERWDDREDYGEERWVAIGLLEGITRDEREAYYRRTGG